MHEKRLTLRLHSYWESLRRDSASIPDIRQFNSESIQDIWEYCFQVSVASTTPRITYKYEYMGSALVNLYGGDLTGQLVKEQSPEFPGMVIYKKFEEVLRTREHLHDSGHFITRNNHLIKYRACLLPFSSGKGEVTNIIIGLSFLVT